MLLKCLYVLVLPPFCPSDPSLPKLLSILLSFSSSLYLRIVSLRTSFQFITQYLIHAETEHHLYTAMDC